MPRTTAHDHGHDLNLRSAYLHVVADAATSVLAIVALAGGWLYGWAWLDPLMGIVGAVLVASWARGLLVETGKVLLDREMDHPVVDEIREGVEQGLADSETRIADLHVWRVGQGAYACALSVVTHSSTLTPDDVRATFSMHEEIRHSTIEIHRCERCMTAPTCAALRTVIEASLRRHGAVIRAGDDDDPCNAMTLFFVHGATRPTCPPTAEDDDVTRAAADAFARSGSPTCTWARPAARREALLDFLKHTECETLFLVGDIIDGWQLRRHWYWPQAHNDVIQKLLRKARKGTRVIFIPGNHDEFARKYLDHNFGGIDVAEEWIHETADGRKLWVMHGDLFDGVIQCAKWLAHVGDSLYEFTLKLNRHLNSLRARMGLPYWSLSKYLKLKVKRAVSYVGDFENAVAREARKRGVQGVVCGHIHHAELRDIDGILYANDGDWVESLTALAEHADGTLEILHWARAHAGRGPRRARRFAARAGARMTRPASARPPNRRPRLLQRRRRASRLGTGAARRRSSAQGLPWTVRLVNLREVLDPKDSFRKLTGMDPEDVYNKRLARGWTLGLAQELKLLQAMIRWGHADAGAPAAAALAGDRARHGGVADPELQPRAVRVARLGAAGRALRDGADRPGGPPAALLDRARARTSTSSAARRSAVQQARAAGYADERIHATSGHDDPLGFYETAAHRPRRRARGGWAWTRSGRPAWCCSAAQGSQGDARHRQAPARHAADPGLRPQRAARQGPARAAGAGAAAGAGLHARRRPLHAAGRLLHRQARARAA